MTRIVWRGLPRRLLAQVRWFLRESEKLWLAFGVPVAALTAAALVPRGNPDQRVREESSRIAGDEKLRQLLEDVAAGGLDFETIGVIWLIAGEVFSSFPAEIGARLSNWL